MHQISRLQMMALEDAAERFFRQRVAHAMSELSAEELKRQGVAPEMVAAFTDKALDQRMEYGLRTQRNLFLYAFCASRLGLSFVGSNSFLTKEFGEHAGTEAVLGKLLWLVSERALVPMSSAEEC